MIFEEKEKPRVEEENLEVAGKSSVVQVEHE
jgi:hypothetical protein